MNRAQATKLERYIDTLGLRYFKGSEFTSLWQRVRKGVQNSVPPERLWENIVEPLVVLDEIRHQAGKPIIMLSTYRSPEYNQAVGGARFSIHMQFGAIDLQAKQGGAVRPAELHRIAVSLRGKTFTNPVTGKKFKFRGGIGLYNTFIHIDCRGVDANW